MRLYWTLAVAGIWCLSIAVIIAITKDVNDELDELLPVDTWNPRVTEQDVVNLDDLGIQVKGGDR